MYSVQKLRSQNILKFCCLEARLKDWMLAASITVPTFSFSPKRHSNMRCLLNSTFIFSYAAVFHKDKRAKILLHQTWVFTHLSTNQGFKRSLHPRFAAPQHVRCGISHAWNTAFAFHGWNIWGYRYLCLLLEE